MNIVAFIPARAGSKGIYNKNIVDFHGSPLIKHTIDVCKKSRYIQEVFVSSDSEEILDLAEQYGAKRIKRPTHLSTDSSPTEDAIEHFLCSIEDPDLVVFLQATSPLREVKDIDNLVERVIVDKLDSAFTACPLEDFFIWNVGEKLESMNYDYRNRRRRQDISGQVVENGSAYCFKSDKFKEHGNRLCGKIGFSLMDAWKMFEVDSREDLEICKLLYKLKGLGDE
jgi:N-acylneuraminate cytidylyltransferase